MSTTSTLRCVALLLAACHLSLSWDASNIWFPDTNNPVFYNLTFYPQAAVSVEAEAALQEATEPPPRRETSTKNRPPPRVSTVFNRQDDDDVATPPRVVQNSRPEVVAQRVDAGQNDNRNRGQSSFQQPGTNNNNNNNNNNSNQNRQSTATNVRTRPIKNRNSQNANNQNQNQNNQNRQPPVANFGTRPVKNRNSQNSQNRQTAIVNAQSRVDAVSNSRPIKERNSLPYRTPQQVQQAVNTAPQAGVRTGFFEQPRRESNLQTQQPTRIPTPYPQTLPPTAVRGDFFEQPRHDINLQTQQPTWVSSPYPQVAVGVKTAPLPADPIFMDYSTYVHDNKQDYQPQGNRLRRTEDDNIGDGGAAYRQMVHYNEARRESRGRNIRGFPDNSNTRNVVERQTNSQRYPEQGNSGAVNGQAENVSRQTQRAEVNAEGERRNWNTEGVTASETPDLVEDNVIPYGETTSIPAGPAMGGPSKCVWAIISCCKPASEQIRYMCFETLGCHGAFWDVNPCSTEMTMAALQATANFYSVPRAEN